MLFSKLASYFQKLEETSSRNAMTEILADLFTHAKSGEIGKLCYLLQGRVVPLYEAIEFGVADKFIIRAIALSYHIPIEDVVREFQRQGDLGKAAEALYAGKEQHLEVREVYDRLFTIATTNGAGSQEKKIEYLADLFRALDSLSVRFVARIPLDKLRLGFSDMTILDALSWMLTQDKSQRARLEDAYNVRPDIGFIAETIKKDGISGLSHVRVAVGSPVLAELCQRLPNAEDMIKKMGEVAVEPKYDGVRVQIHYQKGDAGGSKEIKSFSRNLENTTEMFPELLEAGGELRAKKVILDGEAVGLDPKTGKTISFQETTTRKRKHGIEAARKSVPLKFFIFDILCKDDKDLLMVPLSERREILEHTVIPGKLFVLSPRIITSDPSRIRSYHDEQIRRGLEGVVVKKWNSPYEPGRRGYGWVKFKEEEGKTGKLTDTIDAVVMGYYLGEGKRTGFGIGAFLVGLKKDDHFVTVTKIGTGVSDALWKDIKHQLHAIKVQKQPKEYEGVHNNLTPDVWVGPSIVVELAGDDLTKSSTHGAGFAVRFPRLVRIRHDKSVSQVTTVSEISRMFRNQKSQTNK